MAPLNYDAISNENQRRYGTDIGRIGPMLLADRYDDRTHFIFELLQNAEDAIARRGNTGGSRRVTFTLTKDRLTISHFGRPFDEADVRGICGIAESTKDQRSIGRFGIGFKSVYTFTDRPEIHSGDEDFVVENYVQPKAVERSVRAQGETQIILPFKSEDDAASEEIAASFQHLGPRTLLFLRHIDEINWSVEGGASGVYLRGSPESLGTFVQRVTLIGQESNKREVDQNWLIFHRDVLSTTQEEVGRVEIAFSLAPVRDAPERWSVRQVDTSPLVVFFPTVVSTNLGFLVQGPYRTTPSRDNILRSDPWNQSLIQQTGKLLVDAVRWMRDNGMLDTSTLHCLPIDRSKFQKNSMFEPLFDAVRRAFSEEALLPRFDGGFVSAGQARLARTQDVRNLFSIEQIDSLFGSKECAWLTGDITQDKAPELREYLIQELQVADVTVDKVLSKINKDFIEAQSDAWITRLYAFLNNQKAIVDRLSTTPWVRLNDGTHVSFSKYGNLSVFLPSVIETNFMTVRRSVCGTSEARSFLVHLGLTEPDPVDDVLLNILPKYQAAKINVNDKAYAADIERICTAFGTDSKTQKDKLKNALRQTTFVKVVCTSNGKHYFSRPINIYIATDQMKSLFAGVPDVFIVNDNCDCLRAENIHELLEACGALRCLRPVEAPNALTYDERLELRRQTGHERTSGYGDRVIDWDLAGFEALLALLPTLSPAQRAERARLIWDSLIELEEQRGHGIFDGSYSWTHYGTYKAPSFPAAFLRRLINTAWVSDASSELVRPALVTFESLGWKSNPFLQSKIAFKPPIIDQLAKEAGFDPALLDLLRKHNLTNVADVANRLGITNNAEPPPKKRAETDDEAVDSGSKTQSTDVDLGSLSNRTTDRLSAARASTLGSDKEPSRGALDGSCEYEDNGGAAKRELHTKGSQAALLADEQRPKETYRPGRRNLTGSDGLTEQATRLGRRITSFFDRMPSTKDEEDSNAPTNTGWQTRLVCLDIAAGGLHLEVGPLDGLPSFVKKLRVVGSGWDGVVLAANAKARPTRVSVRPATGPWGWEAVGFEQEQDLGLDKLALEALDLTVPTVFRVDVDGVGQRTASTALSLGQAYRLLLPPNIAHDVGTALEAGWHIWSLDLAVQPSPADRQTLATLGIDIGQAWPRLEWALAAPSAWHTNPRGQSYPVFEAGAELFVNVGGVSVEDSDEAVLFLHGPSGTERLALSLGGLVSLGTPTAGRWACALMHPQTDVRPTTLVFEITKNAVEHVTATWAVIVPEGLASLEATAPPGWPISLRWSGLASHEEPITTLYGDDDRTVSFEGVRSTIEARAARALVADLVVDFRELGRRWIPHDGRASLPQLREQLIAHWRRRSDLVQACAGSWLQLIPAWFEPITTRFGYSIEAVALPIDADAPHDLAAWLLTVDERVEGDVIRSPSRVLILTTNIDAVLGNFRAWIDSTCSAAKVRDAIVTDGTRWTTHRKGDRQLKRREWNLTHFINFGCVDDMLNDFMEGL